MDLVAGVRKEGSRGGRGEFKWDDVKDNQHRENYLGHSLMAPVGRWQKNKDLSWYAKGDASQAAQDAARARAEEIARIKEAEQDALSAALGFPVAPRVTSEGAKFTGANALVVAGAGGMEGMEDAEGGVAVEERGMNERIGADENTRKEVGREKGRRWERSRSRSRDGRRDRDRNGETRHRRHHASDHDRHYKSHQPRRHRSGSRSVDRDTYWRHPARSLSRSRPPPRRRRDLRSPPPRRRPSRSPNPARRSSLRDDRDGYRMKHARSRSRSLEPRRRRRESERDVAVGRDGNRRGDRESERERDRDRDREKHKGRERERSPDGKRSGYQP